MLFHVGLGQLQKHGFGDKHEDLNLLEGDKI